MRSIIPILIAVLAIVGMADSVYLCLMHFGVTAPASGWMARACDFKAGSCESLPRLPEATLFGVPSAVMAIFFYAMVLSAVFIRIFSGAWLLPNAMLAVLGGAVVYGAYLAYVLIARTHVPCPYCLAAHSINFIILILYSGALFLG